jgi:EAL domain-containing protein (putative c-di-GMP-specific phosphodiesterase class I)
MELFLQPIVSAADGLVTRAEGLIRWRHPTGIIPPDQFIPVAERNEQLIDRLTQWVLEAAIKHYLDLSGQGLDIPVWVNLSSLNLHSPTFPDRLVALLAQAGVPPRAIGLEVTESIAMSDVTVVTGILTRLRLKGFSLAIDDFGTGYSSLEALRQMPFSTIKIDKGFITGLPGARDSLKIVRSVIELAHDLGLSTVAEGVESQNVADLLTGFGCTSLQGYFFSRPLPIGEFITWCNSRISLGRPVAAASSV